MPFAQGDLGGPLAAGPRVIDFTNANAARVLTQVCICLPVHPTAITPANLLRQVLLRVDFGLDWWIPEGQLIPPLPNRANYIHWLEDLLALSSPEGMQHAAGLDIGCGTNLIYPLLGCAMHDNWRFVAVDVTPEALHWARRNADANEDLLQGRIVVRESGAPPALGKRHGALIDLLLWWWWWLFASGRQLLFIALHACLAVVDLLPAQRAFYPLHCTRGSDFPLRCVIRPFSSRWSRQAVTHALHLQVGCVM